MMMILCSSSWYRSAMTHRQIYTRIEEKEPASAAPDTEPPGSGSLSRYVDIVNKRLAEEDALTRTLFKGVTWTIKHLN